MPVVYCVLCSFTKDPILLLCNNDLTLTQSTQMKVVDFGNSVAVDEAAYLDLLYIE